MRTYGEFSTAWHQSQTELCQLLLQMEKLTFRDTEQLFQNHQVSVAGLVNSGQVSGHPPRPLRGGITPSFHALPGHSEPPFHAVVSCLSASIPDGSLLKERSRENSCLAHAGAWKWVEVRQMAPSPTHVLVPRSAPQGDRAQEDGAVLAEVKPLC